MQAYDKFTCRYNEGVSMEQVILLFIIALLMGVIVMQDIFYRRERKDLYNRIMARDLPEYKSTTTSSPRYVPNLLKKNLQKNKEKLLK